MPNSNTHVWPTMRLANHTAHLTNAWHGLCTLPYPLTPIASLLRVGLYHDN